MKLISARPYIWLITSRVIVDASCRGERGGEAGCFRGVFSSFANSLWVRQTQRALLTLCSGRFDTASVEIGHALARAFGIVGEYSFASRLISDPGPRCENANFAQRALTKGYLTGAWESRRKRNKERKREFICFKMISTLDVCMLQATFCLRRNADISDFISDDKRYPSFYHIKSRDQKK